MRRRSKGPWLLFSLSAAVSLCATPAPAGRAARSTAAGAPPLQDSSRQGAAARPTVYTCLPKDVRPDEVLTHGGRGRADVTVERALVRMKARCRRGRLVDARRREIRFVRLACWGQPPPDYLRVRRRENEDLERLKARYTVVVFGCNPSIH